MFITHVIILVAVVTIAFVAGRRVRHHFLENARGWKVQKQGIGEIYYVERHSDRWENIRFLERGEDPLRQGWHAINIPSVERWWKPPHWAAGRRSEIVERIRKELPEYAYDDLNEQSASRAQD